ncbi:MAG: ISAs1 family transposase [Thermomicrobiales bacterium]|nr:ISAs1 family transposase [Thermomicrobiales bacterium]
MIGQNAVGSKANEITVIPALLERLVLKGQVITIDAMGCQRSFAEQIVAGGGDYVLAVKGNQGALLEGVVDTFALAPQDTEVDIIVNIRPSTRDMVGWKRAPVRGDCRSSGDRLAQSRALQQWPGLQSIIRITATRASASAPLAVPTTSTRYYISSLLRMQCDSIRSSAATGAIENEVHWVLDMIYREDSSRVRRGYAQQNLAVIRKLTLNLLKSTPNPKKRSLRISRSKTRGLEHGYSDMLGLT